ncbi:MAG: hypothetical protein EON49_15210 [Acidovorax sp.]|nr:MAG: hypothetical protein EON49_15210 [Acidovorax sp.]
MRFIFVLAVSALAGCTPGADMGASRPAVQRDIESYAIASCLAQQTNEYVKDQGDAWASVIVQRMKGDFDALAEISEQVKRESAQDKIPMMRDESNPMRSKALPVMHCGELIDRPAVRAAIQKAVVALRPSYAQE